MVTISVASGVMFGFALVAITSFMLGFIIGADKADD